MAKKKNNYYVVWVGHETGIFDSWQECEANIKGVADAKYKGFPTLQEAQKALEMPYQYFYDKKLKAVMSAAAMADLPQDERPIVPSISVDAACSGNPGVMEYQGVNTQTGEKLFHVGPFDDGNNNTGEFLALVHALALLDKQGSNLPVYSDSKTACSWVRNRHADTKLAHTDKNQKLFQLIARAEKWLLEHDYKNRVLKWDTDKWGEIPADFGRK